MEISNTLSFDGQQLKLDNEEEINKVVDQINSHQNLEILDYRGNTLSARAGELIANALRTKKERKECLWSNMFTGRSKDDISSVLDSLSEALTASECQLKTLDLSHNAFGGGLSKSFLNCLSSPALNKLEMINLSSTGLDGCDVKRLFEFLKSKELKFLGLRNNNIFVKDFQLILDFALKHENLKIDLTESSFGKQFEKFQAAARHTGIIFGKFEQDVLNFDPPTTVITRSTQPKTADKMIDDLLNFGCMKTVDNSTKNATQIRITPG